MLKRILTLISIVFVVSGLALAGNTATITQDGDDNTASATQSGDLNTATIDQIANDSSATQSQTGNNNNATILQEGKWPDGPVFNESASQTQNGNNNVAEIKQITDSTHGGSTAKQVQNSNGNYARAWQFSWNSTIIQKQSVGNNNELQAYQTGNAGYIKQVQEGQDNIAAIDEQGGGGWTLGNTATQTQIGNWNKSLISQYGTGGSKSAEGNEAHVVQNGSDNWAGEGLFGTGLFGIYQEGNYNYARIKQNDNVNKAEAFQYGDFNTINITQNGGSGLFGTYGDYVNKCVVTQTGDGNSGAVNQTYSP